MVPIPIAAVLEPTPAPFATAALPACAAADLSLTFDGEGGGFDGMEHAGTLLVVRNIGPAPCRVPGLPAIAFAGPDGGPLPIRFRPPPGLHPGPAVPPVGIAPGAEATAALRWVSGDAYAPGRCFRPAAVRVSFGDVPVSAPFAARMCGPANGPAPFEQQRLRTDARWKP